MNDERAPDPTDQSTTTPAADVEAARDPESAVRVHATGDGEIARSAAEIAAIVVPIATALGGVAKTYLTQTHETAREQIREDGATDRAIIEANQPPQDPPA